MDWLKEAKNIRKELVRIRRYLHGNAETGFALKKTVAFVEEELKSIGYAPEKCGRSGLVATVGKGTKRSKTFLLRADMDGLPIREESGEAFACKNGNMHACGHDMHTAMLLGAARLLKKNEKELEGQVKLLFQPAEEILEGAKAMLAANALQAPKPDGALSLHVTTDSALPTGSVVVSAGVSAPAADFFTVRVQGKGCHGSAPWNGVDALTAAAHTVIALQEIPAREIPLAQSAVLTVGAFHAGEAGNVIPDSAIFKGTLRAFDEGIRERVKKRLEEISKTVAKAFRATAKISYEGGCPTLVNDKEISEFVLKTVRSALGEDKVFSAQELSADARAGGGGSEDFAYISQEIPSVMLALSAGASAEGYRYPLHHPKARFDEAALPVGSALYAQIASDYLKNG